MLIAIISFILILTLWWDFTLQLGGFNYDLCENRCEWRKKTVKRLKLFFPRMNRLRDGKKIVPSGSYLVIYGFQIAVHILFMILFANSIVSVILFSISSKNTILIYLRCFTLVGLFLGAIILGVAAFVCNKGCKRLIEKMKLY